VSNDSIPCYPKYGHIAFLACFLCGVLGEKVANQTFAIRLGRPERAGNVYDVSLRGARRWSFTGVEGTAVLPELYKSGASTLITIELDARVRIIRVDKRGQVLQKELAITRWEFDDEGEGEGLDLEGKTLLVSWNDGVARFMVDGRQLGDYESEILQVVLSHDMGESRVDARLGSKQPRRIGESWPAEVDRAALEEVLFLRMPSSRGENVSCRRAKGSVKLLERKPYRGIDCLHITARQEWQDFLPSDMVAKEDMKILASTMVSTARGYFPVQTGLRCLLSRQSRRFSLLREITAGPLRGVRIRETVVQTKRRRVKLAH